MWVIKKILTKEIFTPIYEVYRVKIEHYILTYVIMQGLTSNVFVFKMTSPLVP